jgi:hypothetical protein
LEGVWCRGRIERVLRTGTTENIGPAFDQISEVTFVLTELSSDATFWRTAVTETAIAQPAVTETAIAQPAIRATGLLAALVVPVVATEVATDAATHAGELRPCYFGDVHRNI